MPWEGVPELRGGAAGTEPGGHWGVPATEAAGALERRGHGVHVPPDSQQGLGRHSPPPLLSGPCGGGSWSPHPLLPT